MKHTVLAFHEIDSTNDYLLKNYQILQEGTVALALHQTKGKGRLGRKWIDDDSSCLLFSLLLKKELKPERISLLPLLTALSLHNALVRLHISSSIKWPNDVLLNGKKVAGILCESYSENSLLALVIGIGVNVNNQQFPSGLEKKATSLFLYSNKEYDKNKILKLFLEEFDSLYALYQKEDDSYLEILSKNSYLQGKKVHLNYYKENLEGTVIGIDGAGQLVLKKEDGTFLSVNSGEVTLEENYS